MFLKDAARRKINNQKRRSLFKGKIIKKTQISGPDENYGLAEELPPEECPLEDIQNLKLNFLEKLKNIDRG